MGQIYAIRVPRRAVGTDGFGQVVTGLQTLPDGTRVTLPTGTPIYILVSTDIPGETEPVTETRRVLLQDMTSVELAEPVDVLFEPEPAAVSPTPATAAAAVETKGEEETPWYKSPAFVGGVLSVLAFSAIAYLQSRAEAKIK